jgi:hypothetical protein
MLCTGTVVAVTTKQCKRPSVKFKRRSVRLTNEVKPTSKVAMLGCVAVVAASAESTLNQLQTEHLRVKKSGKKADRVKQTLR